LTSLRAATPEELADWDERAVDVVGGHVLQSAAWAEHRRGTGWETDQLVFEDGTAVLVLRRPLPVVGGWSAYVPRGPVSSGQPVEAIAERLGSLVDDLAERGVAVIATDAEIAADTGYPARLAALGFHQIEEIQPSRHRVSLPLAGCDEEAIHGGLGKSTRQRIRKAEEEGIAVVRHDARLPAVGVGEGFVAPAEPTEIALDRFYDLLLETGERRHFSFGPRETALGWWRAALRAGHLILLEARAPDGAPQAGLVLYRHGERLSTVHSADHADARRDHPGALHLLRWRAIQIALSEGRAEMDLGGVDVAGARREPREGEEMWGLYQHKRSFGGVWLELSGAHERVIDAGRYRLGQVITRLDRMVGRR
jgi:lipid II:glycine glycyltransferase (peptidoglycan interpeptide bridge formation enzyme)